MQVPVYNNKESLSQYMRRVEEYKLYVKQSQYENVLKFINDLVYKDKETITSLSKFTNIPKSKFDSEIIHCSEVFSKNKKLLEDIIGTKISTTFDDSDYIIYCLTRLIKSVGYILRRKEIDCEIYYSIRHRKEFENSK